MLVLGPPAHLKAIGSKPSLLSFASSLSSSKVAFLDALFVTLFLHGKLVGCNVRCLFTVLSLCLLAALLNMLNCLLRLNNPEWVELNLRHPRLLVRLIRSLLVSLCGLLDGVEKQYGLRNGFGNLQEES